METSISERAVEHGNDLLNRFSVFGSTGNINVSTSGENEIDRVSFPSVSFPRVHFDLQTIHDTSVQDEINRVSSLFHYSATPLSSSTVYSSPSGLQSYPHPCNAQGQMTSVFVPKVR